MEKKAFSFIKKGYITPSKSTWGALVLFQMKKDTSLRLFMDYRGLNKSTINKKFSLPIINGLVDQLNGIETFSNIDLRPRYN